MARLEVCAGSVGGALTAAAAGASRIELNSGLSTGGLTPSPGVIREVLKELSVPLAVMLRPRSGGFVYSAVEKRAILFDMENALVQGADSIVFGALLPGDQPDYDFVSTVRKEAGGARVVFHRAIDLTVNPAAVLEELIRLGIDGVLTSGGKGTAWEGRFVLREMERASGGSVEVIAASGITSANAAGLASITGCRWIHGSFSAGEKGESCGGIVPPGDPGPSPGEIAKTLQSLDQMW